MKEKIINFHMLFFPFSCSGIADLVLGILEMVIGVYFPDALQPAFYLFFRVMT